MNAAETFLRQDAMEKAMEKALSMASEALEKQKKEHRKELEKLAEAHRIELKRTQDSIIESMSALVQNVREKSDEKDLQVKSLATSLAQLSEEQKQSNQKQEKAANEAKQKQEALEKDFADQKDQLSTVEANLADAERKQGELQLQVEKLKRNFTWGQVVGMTLGGIGVSLSAMSLSVHFVKHVSFCLVKILGFSCPLLVFCGIAVLILGGSIYWWYSPADVDTSEQLHNAINGDASNVARGDLSSIIVDGALDEEKMIKFAEDAKGLFNSSPPGPELLKALTVYSQAVDSNTPVETKEIRAAVQTGDVPTAINVSSVPCAKPFCQVGLTKGNGDFL
jgi:hypothetical protein